MVVVLDRHHYEPPEHLKYSYIGRTEYEVKMEEPKEEKLLYFCPDCKGHHEFKACHDPEQIYCSHCGHVFNKEAKKSVPRLARKNK